LAAPETGNRFNARHRVSRRALEGQLDGIALYGAVVGSISILWQVYSWRRDHSTKIKVEVSLGALTFGPKVEKAVIITAVNDSRHPIRINSAGLETQDRSGNWAVKPLVPNGAGIPGTIQPNDSAQTWWFWEEFEEAGFDPHKPLVARVMAGNGQRFRSKRQPLFKT